MFGMLKSEDGRNGDLSLEFIAGELVRRWSCCAACNRSCIMLDLLMFCCT